MPVAIRQNPREIVFNTSHPAHPNGAHETLALRLALEIAYLESDPTDATGLYERMVWLPQAL